MNPLTQVILHTYAVAILILAQAGRSADRVEYTVTDLKTPDGTFLLPTKINDRGEVVGYADDSNNISHPFLYRNGAVQQLGQHGNPGYPFALNNAGDILCWFGTNPNAYGVLITSDGSEIKLSQALGHEFWPVAMNDEGDILGYGVNYDASYAILVYNHITGTVRELENPSTNNVKDINNNGNVVGTTGILATIFHGTS